MTRAVRAGLAVVAALAIVALMLVASIAPLAEALAPSQAAGLGGAAQATGSTTATTNNTAARAELYARLLMCSFTVKGFLARLGVADYTNVTLIEQKLHVNATTAQLIAEVANITPAVLREMNLTQLREVWEKARKVCSLIGDIAKELAIRERLRVEEMLLRRVEARINQTLRVLVGTINASMVSEQLQMLREALRAGDTAKAREILANLTALLQTVRLYMAVEKVNRLLSMVEAKLNKTGTNATVYPPVRVPVKLVEKLERLLERNLRFVAKLNRSAVPILHGIILKLRSDIMLVKMRAKLLVKAQKEAAEACINSTTVALEKLRGELEKLKANATIASKHSEELRKAGKLLDIAEKLLGEAERKLTRGEYMAAFALCSQARFKLFEAQLLLTVATGKTIVTINITLPPVREIQEEMVKEALNRTHLVLVKLNETVAKLREEVAKSNNTRAATMLEKLEKLVANLWRLYGEAEKALEENNTALALRLLARLHAGIAEAFHLAAAIKLTLALGKAALPPLPHKGNKTKGNETVAELKKAISELKDELRKLIKKIEEAKEKAKNPADRMLLSMLENMARKALEALDRAVKLLESGNIPAAKALVEKAKALYEKVLKELEQLLGQQP